MVKKNGLYKSYHCNGQLWVECNYTNNKRTGLYKSYWNRRLEYLCYDINNVEYYLKYAENEFAIMI